MIDIMPPTYQQNKIHIYNYRAKNIEKHREFNRINVYKYNMWNKAKKEFLAILRDDCIFVN